MSEHENSNNENIGENGNGLIDLGSTESSFFDPFGDTSFPDEPDFEQETSLEDEPEAESEDDAPETVPESNTPAPSSSKPQVSVNPLEAAVDAAETKEAEQASQSLFTKPPVFSYAAANEAVEDTSITFEELRAAKETDFPELGDAKRVSWTVEYGKITKSVPNPKATTIAKIKSDIETSKEFLESLKKAKDKAPVCKLKPKVIAQSKGTVSAYKGVYTNLEDAVASGKLITLMPARDGKVYQMRNTELGKFITPSAGSELLSVVEAGFTPALPLIPENYLRDIIGFFREMAHKGNFEALANIYWDKEALEFVVDIPEQVVTPVSVESTVSAEYDSDRYLLYVEIHSHNTMKAFFSSVDDHDEKATRVYAVVGKVFDYFPQIKVRISNGGTFLEIDPETVFEDLDCFVPDEWLEKVKSNKVEPPALLSALSHELAGDRL